MRLHDQLSVTGYTLIVTGLATDAEALAARLREHWQLDLRLLVITPDWQVARDLDGQVPVLLDRGRQARVLHGRRPLAFLVRPDRHVGYAGPLDPARMDAHLATAATPRPARTPVGTP